MLLNKFDTNKYDREKGIERSNADELLIMEDVYDVKWGNV